MLAIKFSIFRNVFQLSCNQFHLLLQSFQDAVYKESGYLDFSVPRLKGHLHFELLHFINLHEFEIILIMYFLMQDMYQCHYMLAIRYHEVDSR